MVTQVVARHRRTGAFVVGLAAGAGLAFRGSIGPFLGVAVVAAIALLSIERLARDSPGLRLVLLGAFASRFAVIALDTSLGLFPKLDAISYHRNAAALANVLWHGGTWEAGLALKTASYEVVIGPLYAWFGPSPLVARTFNALLATLAAFNVYRIGEAVFDRRAALGGATIFALMPSMVRLHGEHLREALIILIVTEIVYLVVTTRFHTRAGAVLLLAGLAWLSLLRPETFLVLLAPVLLEGAQLVQDRLDVRGQSGYWTSERVTLLLLAGILGAILFSNAIGQDVLSQGFLSSPEDLSSYRDAWTEGGSKYLDWVTFDSWIDVILFAPLGAAFFLLTPFPWQVHDPLALVAALENLLLYWPVVILAVPEMKSRWTDPGRRFLLLFLLISSLGFGLVEGNIGTALRHRAQFTWIFFLFAGPTLSKVFSPRGAPSSSADIPG